MLRKPETRVRRFFAKRLAPAAAALRGRGVQLLPPGPEDDAETWYVDGPSGEPEFVRLETDDCEAMLRSRWQDEGLPELAGLAGPLLELAARLEVTQEDSGEISPFLYVMY